MGLQRTVVTPDVRLLVLMHVRENVVQKRCHARDLSSREWHKVNASVQQLSHSCLVSLARLLDPRWSCIHGTTNQS